MELRIKTGNLTNSLSILNTYAPDSNREFNEINERRGATENYMPNLLPNIMY